MDSKGFGEFQKALKYSLGHFKGIFGHSKRYSDFKRALALFVSDCDFGEL